MKIAVPFADGEVFQHLGHTENFKLYEIEAGQIVSSEIIGTNGSGHEALANFLSSLSATKRHRLYALWLPPKPRRAWDGNLS